MRVLVVGAGAREHAIIRGLRADSEVASIVAAPGNAGISAELGAAALRPLALGDTSTVAAEVAALAVEVAADLVVIGPEGPLVAGAADAVRAKGIDCFGPSAAAAEIEGSKAFAKEIMVAAGVPTAESRVCTTPAETEAALDLFGAPYVVKADGLAGGKGVVVTEDRMAALTHAMRCGRVVIEEYLDGPEVSLFALTDGSAIVPLPPAQDFKRVGDGDTGLNTGGMGAYSPLPWAPAGLSEEVLERVIRPTVREMARRGTPYSGLLYAGLALTSRGLKVVEFNARFGDPETQVVLPLLDAPLGQLLQAVAQGRLGEFPDVRTRSDAAVTVVIAAPGYPGEVLLGGVIQGLEAVREPAYVLHAGTKLDDEGRTVAAGGRVLSVTAVAPDLAAARAAVYAGVGEVHLDGGISRSDIALKAVAQN